MRDRRTLAGFVCGAADRIAMDRRRRDESTGNGMDPGSTVVSDTHRDYLRAIRGPASRRTARPHSQSGEAGLVQQGSARGVSPPLSSSPCRREWRELHLPDTTHCGWLESRFYLGDRSERHKS